MAVTAAIMNKDPVWRTGLPVGDRPVKQMKGAQENFLKRVFAPSDFKTFPHKFKTFPHKLKYFREDTRFLALRTLSAF